MSLGFFGKLILAVVAPLGILGCSDPVPQAAGVGLTLNVGRCPTTMLGAWTVGSPAPDSTRADNPLGKPVFSGSSGASVTCRVTSAGNINATVEGPNKLGFQVGGSINPQSGIGTASISLYAGTPDWVRQPYDAADSPCTLEVIRTTTGLKFNTGTVWAKFNCQNLEAKPNTICSAQGEFVLEKCDD